MISTANWIARTRSHPQLRLFCFPYAGGGASIYRQWSGKVPPEVEVCPVYLPGRENRIREPLFTEMPVLVQELAEGLKPYLDVPFAFFGHSLGAIIAFELARCLRREQLPVPVGLFVSARQAPQLPERGPMIHQMPDAEFIDSIRRLGGTPEAVFRHEELMQVMLPILRADFALYETYRYKEEPPLTCMISAFAGEKDDTVSAREMVGWRAQTLGPFSLRILPGEHFFLHSSQDRLLECISQDLTALLRGCQE